MGQDMVVNLNKPTNYNTKGDNYEYTRTDRAGV